MPIRMDTAGTIAGNSTARLTPKTRLTVGGKGPNPLHQFLHHHWKHGGCRCAGPRIHTDETAAELFDVTDPDESCIVLGTGMAKRQ